MSIQFEVRKNIENKRNKIELKFQKEKKNR